MAGERVFDESARYLYSVRSQSPLKATGEYLLPTTLLPFSLSSRHITFNLQPSADIVESNVTIGTFDTFTIQCLQFYSAETRTVA